MLLTADHSKQSNKSLLSRLNFIICRITNHITTGYDQENASASSFHTNFNMAQQLLLTDLIGLVHVLMPTDYYSCTLTTPWKRKTTAATTALLVAGVAPWHAPGGSFYNYVV